MRLGGYPFGRRCEQLAVKLTELERKLAGHDHAIRNLFETIRQLLETPEPTRKEMGFHTTLKKPGP